MTACDCNATDVVSAWWDVATQRSDGSLGRFEESCLASPWMFALIVLSTLLYAADTVVAAIAVLRIGTNEQQTNTSASATASTAVSRSKKECELVSGTQQVYRPYPVGSRVVIGSNGRLQPVELFARASNVRCEARQTMPPTAWSSAATKY